MKSEISGALKERLGSNIVGTFSLSFAILNWKFFVYLFSSLEVNAKIEIAQNELNSRALINIFASLMITLGILVLGPFLKSIYDKYYYRVSASSELSKLRNENMVLAEISGFNDSARRLMSTKHQMNSALAAIHGLSEDIRRLKNNSHDANWIKNNLNDIESKTKNAATSLQNILSEFSTHESFYQQFHEKTQELIQRYKKAKP